jgi:hypothetical protein
VRDAISSVAVVRVSDGHGSGFMAAPNVLVTNYHVIGKSRMTDVRVVYPDNPGVSRRSFTAELIAEDPIHDLAVLKVESGVTPLPIDEVYEHVNGQKVVAIGSPGTGGSSGEMLANLTTDGRLGPAYDLANGAACWALAMPINPGNSGGPIIDAASGHVVGVVVATFTKTQSQALAVPHRELQAMLRRAHSATPADRQQAATLHRARYCLSHMGRLLNLTELSFNKSCEATEAADTDDDKLAVFNNFKSRCSQVLSDEFATFDTTVTAEVAALRHDAECDMATRLAVTRLHETITKQLADIRKSVALREVGGFLRDYRESLARGHALARSTAKSLAVEIEEEEEEE